MSLASVFDIAAMGMSAQSVRLNTTASNLANAETVAGSEAEAYKARRPVFTAAAVGFDRDSGRVGQHSGERFGVMVREIVTTKAAVNRAYEPAHPLADKQGYIFYSNVNTVEEMADMISASRAFQMNVEIMNTTKSMMQRMLTLGQ